MDHPDRDVYLGQVLDGRWEVCAYLGKGHFSNVYQGKDLATDAPCAVKILALQHHHDARATVEFETECELLELLEHRSNVVDRLAHGKHSMSAQIGAATVPLKVPYLVLELADGDLEELLLDRHRVDWEDRLKIFRGVTKGLHQMQLDRVAYRDMKAENILLIQDGREATAKVGDLGRARSLRTATRFPLPEYEHGRGDLRFAPPELLWGLGSTEPELLRLADLYLLGSTLFELATGQGITAMAIGNPGQILRATAGLSPTKREQSFKAHASDLQTRYQLAYELFDREISPCLREVGGNLLRMLTAVEPTDREPRFAQRRKGDERWDLQWVLRRIDILIHNHRVHRSGARRS